VCEPELLEEKMQQMSSTPIVGKRVVVDYDISRNWTDRKGDSLGKTYFGEK
jgi:hypothetical protein